MYIINVYYTYILYTKDFAFNQTFQLIYEGSESTGLADYIGTPTTMAHALRDGSDFSCFHRDFFIL